MKTIGQFLLPTHYRTASYLRPIDPGWQLGHNRTFSMRSSDAEKFEDPGRQKVNYKSAVKSHKWTISWVAFLLAFEAYATAGVYLSIFTLIVNLVFRLPFHLWRWKVSKLGSVDYIYRCLALIFVSICIIPNFPLAPISNGSH